MRAKPVEMSLFLCAFLLPAAAAPAQKVEAPAPAPKDWRYAPPEAVDAWRQMRFGIFIHWGPGSMTGKELSWARKHNQVPAAEYDRLYKKFNPARFNADEWAKTIADAGARYMVFTAKHHDGFVNYDTQLTDYKITSPDSPFKKDIVRALSDAARKKNLMFGIYYSQRDWHNPDFLEGNYGSLAKHIRGQMEELCTNYGSIGEVWFDATAFGARQWDAENLFKLIRKLQPNVLINDRCGLRGDFSTPERRVGGFDRRRPWESCIQLGTQWSWKPDDNIKSLKECIEALLMCAGGDGNLLLNVGPMPDGRIEPRQAERLLEIGAWLKKNGQAIYGTRGGPFRPGEWGVSTCKGEKVYLAVTKWPKQSPLSLPPIGRKITGAALLAGGEATVQQSDRGVTVSVAEKDRGDIATVVELTVDGPALEITPLAVAPAPSTSPPMWERGLKSNHASRRNCGSAKLLVGRVCLYNVFVSGPGTSWSQADKAEVRKRMDEAMAFLTAQAERYKVKVEFVQVTAEAAVPAEIPADPFAHPGWMEAAIKLASGKNGNERVKQLRETEKADQVAVMLHVNRNSTSYNLAYYANVHPAYAAERAVMFLRYEDQNPTAAASYAHEILHMFGAGELYFPFDRDEKRLHMAECYWPNDIMLRVDYDMSKLAIGEYTAYRIGWVDKLKPDYRVFEDPG